MWQPKSLIDKLNNYNCDNSKNQIVTKFKNSTSDKLKTLIDDNTQKRKRLQIKKFNLERKNSYYANILFQTKKKYFGQIIWTP